MARVSRRAFLQGAMSASAALLTGCQVVGSVTSQSKAHVVVVGGGFGGATAAKYIRQLDAGIKVTLIEPKPRYITCPGSNWLFAGLTNLKQLTVDYQALQALHGITVVTDSVTEINASRRLLNLSGGQSMGYDRLILSPGISFQWDALEGYDQATAEIFPHAWQAGPQTLLLIKQLQALPDGGVVLMSVPADPYRCPPGPYERASMMACWLKQHNPRAKILILDQKRSFSKQALFEAGWARHFAYGTTQSIIEWHSLADNPLQHLDARSKTLHSEFGDRFKGDVLNIIPPQQAGKIALQSGLSDASGWCPVKSQTAQSVFDDYIHLIGDAAHYAPIPKSAFAANSEAKACAFAVVNLLNDRPLEEAHWLNTCYSLITPEHGISVAGVYRQDQNQAVMAVKGAGGVSIQTDPESLAREARYAGAVYRHLLSDSFG